MSGERTASVTFPPVPAIDILTEAEDLLAGLLREPWGQVSPSVYETGRLVALSPWLTGHDRRIDYLLLSQRPDGGWGSPEPGYALVPTLSATDALLSAGRPGTREAATTGLRVLFHWLRGPGALTAADLPDLPAIELIVPSLVMSINRRLDDTGDAPPAGWWPGTERLRIPVGVSDAPLLLILSRLSAGQALPQKLAHALEVAGAAAHRHPLFRPETTGTVGASPAATAAWLGDPDDDAGSSAAAFLREAVRRHAGPVPCGLPVTVFERGWVLGWLIRVGIPIDPPAELVTGLTASLGPTGTAAAAGLPQDADTTAAALYALALAGAPRPPDPLWAYESGDHFSTWPGEQGVSITTNAHVLEAFGQYQRVADGPDDARRAATVAKVAAWLRHQQRRDGSWRDRWHASPYYATFCAALALDAFGGAQSAAAVGHAVHWALATQRADGSWGRWAGTAEETAYALQLLLATGHGRGAGPDDAIRRAAARGCEYLIRCPRDPDGPALWHDKDLYQPIAIVKAGVLAALHLGRRDGFLD